MRILILQPPLVQLNTPYPAGAYLQSFFTLLASGTLCNNLQKFPQAFRDCIQTAGSAISSVEWIDTGISLFHRIFCRAGIEFLFTKSASSAVAQAELEPDSPVASQLRRYLSMQNHWIDWIDDIVQILETGNRERAHEFIRSPYVPRGNRMDGFLESIDHELTVDDAQLLASLAIEDIADYITAVYDSNFSLVRYGESIAESIHSFSALVPMLQAPLLVDYYAPILQELWKKNATQEPVMLCITIPFPGCLAAAVFAAESAKRFFGNQVTVVMGGGYVNTELRSLTASSFFEYTDFLSFDRGYGSLAAITAAVAVNAIDPITVTKNCQHATLPIYNTMFRGSGDVIISGIDGKQSETEFSTEYRCFESLVTESLVPDFCGIDFLQYPHLADSQNPMHRLWSDGCWLKAYLAHGCYWHNCSFCDVQLDYICAYKPVNVTALYDGLLEQAKKTGVYGIHFVDEAAPPKMLKEFAIQNILHGSPLTFWGNIRFEKTFTRDFADLLARGGLIGVSGGIEIATDAGFKATGKGINLQTLVNAAAAFKEAGILVHAYLIYGYWNESSQDIIDSMETMRQLFAAGLIDSAFWHKFVLTRHSRIFKEWTAGKHSDLIPVLPESDFACNDCRFKGEESFERYTAPLDAALAAWMNGEYLMEPVEKWFPFKMPHSSASPNLIADYIACYEQKTAIERSAPYNPADEYLWAGGIPIAIPESGADYVEYQFMNDVISAVLPTQTVTFLRDAVVNVHVFCNEPAVAAVSRKSFKKLRHNGLLLVRKSEK